MFSDSGIKNKLSPLSALIGIALAVFTVIGIAPLANFFVEFIAKTGYNMDNLSSMQITNVGELFLGLFFMCMLPAFCEEFLYRGHIARAFGEKGYVFSILMTSLFFAIMHGSPVQLVHQFFLGIVLCVAYFMTRSLWMPVIIHFVNNAMAVIGNYWLNVKGAQLNIPIWLSIMMIVFGILSVCVFVYLLYIVNKKNRQKMSYEALKCDNKIDNIINELYMSETETIALKNEQELLDSQLEKCENQETKEVLLATLSEEKSKINKRNQRAIIFSLILGLGVWILNTIMGYLS